MTSNSSESSSIDAGRQLMAQFQAGDEQAFEQLVGLYQTPVYRVIFRYLNDADLANDLTQETWVRVYQSKATYRPLAKFTTWVFQIAIHLCLEEKRKRRRETSLDERVDAEGAPRDFEDRKNLTPPALTDQEAVSRAVAQAVQELPATQRGLLILTHYEHLSAVEAAKVLGISAVGARLRLMRARAVLRKKLSSWM